MLNIEITFPGSLAGGTGAVKKATQVLEDEKFHVIPAGQQALESPMGAERPALSQLINCLTDDYSYVIYDGPPVLRRNEPLALAAAFDGVVMVVKANESRTEVASSAKDKLIQAGANVIGAIFNHRKYYVPQWVYDLL